MPKLKKVKNGEGTLSLGLAETPGLAFSGEVLTGSYSPLALSGSVTETYEGGPTCGQPVGNKTAKAVKKGAFSGAAVKL